MILKIPHQTWSKNESGINPPPKLKVLKSFLRVQEAKTYEETELISLAKRWKPSAKTNHPHELLLPPTESIPLLGEIEFNRRVEAAMEANKPEYEHRHFRMPSNQAEVN